jgi:hypothetical protein
MSVACAGGDVVDDSAIAQIVSKKPVSDWDTFDNTTDSLEALADNSVTPASIEDAVWDAARADHTDAGSMGEGVNSEALNTQAKADVNAEALIARFQKAP